MFKILLAACQKVVGLLVAGYYNTALEVADFLEGDDFACRFVIRLEFFEGSFVGEPQKVFDHRLRFQLWNLKQLIKEHLENHHAFSEMLIVIAAELSFLCNGRDWKPGMQPLQCPLQPLKIGISPSNRGT